MVSIALDSAYRRVSIAEFLAMDFGGAKAELEDGIIFMMAGGSEEHARIAANIIMTLGPRLRGSGCRPYGSDFATRTDEGTIRFPDVSVYCNDPAAPENKRKQLLGDPAAVFEVLSPSTAAHDQRVKLEEYRGLAGLGDIVLVDPVSERIRHVRRNADGDWVDGWLSPGAELALGSLGVTLQAADIFAAD